MRLFKLRDHGWAVETTDGLFELESPWLGLMDGEPVVGAPLSGTLPLQAPVDPTKIVCVGLNYARHAAEMDKQVPDEPLLFMKPLTTISAPGGEIRLPKQSQLVHHEGELAVVIGRRLRDATLQEAQAGIFGYTCANDVTARDIQRREKRYTRAKGFDTFCPIGPAVVLAKAFDPAEHRLELRVNGELRQQSQLNDFIFSIPRAVSFISEVMTLMPGDVILTGTPSGVNELMAGDRVEVDIDGIGVLTSAVV